MVNRGDIWLAQLEPSGDRVLDGMHSCLIVSPPEIHDYLGLVVVAPITQGDRPAGFRIPAQAGGQDGVVRLEQLRTIDKRSLTRQIGEVEPKVLTSALAALREMFAE